MKYLYLIPLILFVFQSSYAESTNIKLEYDQVSIGYIPSRLASRTGEPHTSLVAQALIHHENREIENFFIQLKSLASEGILDNATHFHKPIKYIEAIVKGERVRLLYAGNSKLAKFKNYEERWKVLHNKLFEYLVLEISPNKSIQPNAKASVD